MSAHGLNWRIYVDMSGFNANAGTPFRSEGNGFSTETITYTIPSGATMATIKRSDGNAPYFEMRGHKPELPPGFENVQVTKVTAVGTPSNYNTKPGVYDLGQASAVIRKGSNHDLKIEEFSAPSLETAWELYKAVLRSDDGMRTVDFK